MPSGPGWSIAKHGAGVGILALVLSISLVAPALAQWQITSPDGCSSLKLGYLLQGRVEWDKADTEGDGTTAQNLYLRRTRLLLAGKINDRLSFFAQTDAANLGKAGEDGVKEYPDVFLQDCMGTWTAQDAFLLDFGLLFTPGTYNHLQSAATLLGLDYGPYTFVESAPLGARTGRDVGVQARGVLAQRHFEYRAAVLQGVRGAGARNSFRFAGRLAFTPFEAANALFYGGPSLGKQKVCTIGLAADAQRDYLAYSGDVFVDYPFDENTSLMLQGAFCIYDGGGFLGGTQYAEGNIYQQNTYLLEAGLTLLPQKITPFVQVAGRLCDDDVVNGRDERSVQVGLAYWLDGHTSSIKAGYTLAKRDRDPDHALFVIQCQAYGF